MNTGRFKHNPKTDAIEVELLSRVAAGLREALSREMGRGLSKRSIMRKAGMHPETVRNHVAGKDNLTLRTMARIAHACGCRVEFTFPRRYSEAVAEIRAKKAEPKMPSLNDAIGLISAAPLPRIPIESSRPTQGQTMMPRTTKLILCGIATIGFEWTTLKTIEYHCGVSEARLCEVLPAVEKAGLIEVQRRGRSGKTTGGGLARFRVRTETLRGLILGTVTIGGVHGEGDQSVAASSVQDSGGEAGEDRSVGGPSGEVAEEACA